MSILVIDQSPELFWYVSSALRQDEIPMKHLPLINDAEETILFDLPQIVIMNGDDGLTFVTNVISKIRNHVFARGTIFIVFTSSADPEIRRSLLISGAGFVLHRKPNQAPPIKYFQGIVKWLLTIKNPEQNLFTYRPVPFISGAEWSTYGRVGWISSTHILIESNLALEPGQTIEFHSLTLTDLEIKGTQVQCIEKNKVGRYYQYANSLLCKIIFKNPKDEKILANWVENNHKISKNKNIKVVYFESDPKYRDQIRTMIKKDVKYCIRGYADLNNFKDDLEYQLPQLILVNRALIQLDKNKFEAIKAFLKNNFSYCVTYATDDIFSIEDFKKNYPFAMHTKEPINISLLEGMIQKLEEKIPNNNKESEEKKIYFNKHSIYSRVTLHANCQITEISESGMGIILPYVMSNYCGFELTTQTFGVAKLKETQFFRTFFSKVPADRSRGIYHRCLLIGNTLSDINSIHEAKELIAKVGFDRWLVGDTDIKKKL